MDANFNRDGHVTSFNATQEDVDEGGLGGCLHCGAEADGVEPDARNVECEDCGGEGVFGLEELAVMGKLKLVAGEVDTDELGECLA